MMAPVPWLVWLDAADVAAFQSAYPQAQVVRPDRVEPGILVYQVTLDVLPGGTSFPLRDGARWDHVDGGYHLPDQPDAPVAALPCHWCRRADAAAPPDAPPPPDAVTWQQDQWVVTDDGSGPAITKAAHAGWDEEDDLYTVKVFDAKDAALDWLYERAAFYRHQEEPPYDEEEDQEDEDEEEDQEDEDEDGWDTDDEGEDA
jgi:hypothetical protein